MSEPPDDADATTLRRGALVALVVILVLVVAGIWLGRMLHRASEVQDCVMAGRTNCAPLSSPSSGRSS